MGNDKCVNAFDHKWDTSEYLTLPSTGYRDEVIESCAKVADDYDDDPLGDPIRLAVISTAREIAATIRALKSET